MGAQALKRVAAALALAVALGMAGCVLEGGVVDGDGSEGGGDGDGSGSGGGGGGNTSVVREMVLKNSTGYTVSGIYIKSSTSTDWGNNLYGYNSLSDGASRTLSFSQPLSADGAYDIRLSASSGGSVFIKYGVSLSNGKTVTLTIGDLTDESEFPSVTVQNRTGISFNAIYIRPSAVSETSSDWGKNYGSLSNNSDNTVTIPIPPSNYTEFDIQMTSSNPTNTYTRKNVAVSNGMVLTYTSADSDNPLTALPVIVLKNGTGYTISGIYIKAPTSTDWGNNLYGYNSLSDGASRTFSLSRPLSANDAYDIELSASTGGVVFIKYNVTVSEGIIVAFTVGDLDDESSQPRITVQNRTGVNFNAIYIRPSAVSESSSDWGKNYGSLSNNSDNTVTVPIPPYNYTEFDIQMTSSNPTNTYTKKNVTVSNGMVLTYTSADSDNPLTALPVIVLKNGTGYTVSGIYIKASTSTVWGTNLYGYNSLSDGASRTFSLSQSLSANNVYDIKLNASSGGYEFIKYNVSVSEGMIVAFTVGDLAVGQ
jgi:hypothetical protein